MGYEASGVLEGLVACDECEGQLVWHERAKKYRCDEHPSVNVPGLDLERKVLAAVQTQLDRADAGTIADEIVEHFKNNPKLPARKHILSRAVLMKNHLLDQCAGECEVRRMTLAFCVELIRVSAPLPFRERCGVSLVVRAFGDDGDDSFEQLSLEE